MSISIPFVLFCVLIVVYWGELGPLGVGAAVAVWIALYLGLLAALLSPFGFVVAQGILDIILILAVLGGQITRR
jgi:hypothetical protein